MNNASLELGGDNWAAKDGNLLGYAVGDSSGKYVPNEFTFTRGSNLSATRINEQGYIEKGYENTLLGSNDWAQSTSVYEITGGEAGYDGTNDAWLVDKLAPGYFGKGNVSVSGVSTISLYAKAGTLDRIFVFYSGEAARFDLTNATASKAGGTTIAQSIELVSGTTDWYRCSMVIDKTITTSLLIKPQNSSNQDVAGTIYIQDAMVNQGLAALPYLETTATTVKAGVLEDTPRLDYSGGATEPSLLLEPQRTNELANSEYFEAGTLSNATLSISGTSLENVNNAYALTENTANAEHYWISEQMTTATNNNLVSTIFVKPNGRTKIRLWNYHLANQFGRVDVDLTNNTTSNGVGTNVTFVSANVTDYSNGWKRVEIQSIKSSSTYPYRIRVTILNDNGSDVYAGDGTSGVLIYGAQMEQDATYPTSYIPTYGVSQTRGAEYCSDANTNSTGDYFSVFLDYFNFKNGGLSGDNSLIFKDSNENIIFTLWGLGGGFAIRSFSGDSNGGYYTSNQFGKTAKALVRYNGSNIDLFIDGVKETITSPSASETNWNQIAEVDTLRASDNKYNLKQMLVFDSALSDADCITLTTI